MTTPFRLFVLTGLLAMLMLPAFSQQRNDSAMYAFVNRLIGQMTLDEKIGQLNLLTSDMAVTGPTMRKAYLDDIKAGRCGGIFNAFGPDYVRKLQEIAVDSTRLHIPLLFGFDVIHGHKTIFPIPLGMACSWDTTGIAHAARIAATEAAADGLNWVFSPMVDLARDPRWGRVAEGAGEDPYLGSLIARAYVKGYQGHNLADSTTVMACVKHYALYGAVEAGREYNIVDMSRRRMFEDYLPPYKAAIDAGVGSVMSAFNEINGIPATANHWLLTDLLRRQWHFQGFVVTDYDAIPELINHGIAADTAEASKWAFEAGAEMDMQGLAYIHHLKTLVENGQISEDAIDQAVRDILIAKYRLGLFQDPYNRINEARARREIMSPDKLQFAREMARESIVLLKNAHQLLPLKKSGTIAVIGPLADDQRDMIGCWSGAGDWHQAVSILQGIREAAGNQARILYARGANITDDTSLLRQLNAFGGDIQLAKESPQQLIRQAVAVARKADVVVMCLGESQGMSGEAASRADIHIPENQRELLKAVYATGKPIVLVLSNGRPLVLKWESEHIPAILETWFLGTEAGHAIADVLFGDYNPSGKLTMSFPYAVGQIPVYYNHKNTGRPGNPDVKWTSKYLDIPNDPLYPFGYGLSYAHFTYGPLQLDKEVLMPGDQLHVRVTLTNDGDRDGTEIVQLYIRDRVADVTQPVKVLKGFQRVFLKKGESKTLEFTLSADDLRIYDRHMHYRYEPGVFDVFVGGNSRDVQQASFTLK
ncbi:MAG: beta-glucosidase BglX [Thermoflavifilum sp.]|uniref:beta-glucosidase BglX n=1 Tax=Thermoflavifilum sp. TaxID=1968839 RepID=UPI0018A3DA7F|nr:beta-glucosidase BglX [Thermoflavifilum sp.]QOR76077.1 MAG: beta-glucosidase BglX [Thermoflavifilum sp.]